MKQDTETFTPAEGVTMDNALRFIEAIENAVRNGINSVPRESRSLMIGIVSGALAQTSQTLKRFKDDLEERGEADPVTEEQRLQLRMMFRSAVGKDKPES